MDWRPICVLANIAKTMFFIPTLALRYFVSHVNTYLGLVTNCISWEPRAEICLHGCLCMIISNRIYHEQRICHTYAEFISNYETIQGNGSGCVCHPSLLLGMYVISCRQAREMPSENIEEHGNSLQFEAIRQALVLTFSSSPVHLSEICSSTRENSNVFISIPSAICHCQCYFYVLW